MIHAVQRQAGGITNSLDPCTHAYIVYQGRAKCENALSWLIFLKKAWPLGALLICYMVVAK